MNKEVLDYNSILENCGVGKSSAQVVIKNIANLEEFYDSTELISIYNYCLLNIDDSEILISVIKYSDAYRAKSTLAILLQLLELKTDEEDEKIVNLRRICI